MAFLDVREPLSAALLPLIPGAPFAVADNAVADVVGFTPAEWDVILLARNDRLSSLAEPTRLSRLSAWMFGGGIARQLADPRLEALRRLAVQAWHHGYAAPVSAMKAFKAAGFNLDQLELLLASIAAGRSDRTKRAFA
jgi:hypothetical protein